MQNSFFFWKKKNIYQPIMETILLQIKDNRLSKFIKSVNPNELTEEHVLCAIKYGRTNFLNWIYENCNRRFYLSKNGHPFECFSCHILDYAVKAEKIKVLDWILEKCPNEICTEKSALFCSISGSVTILKWLFQHRPEFNPRNLNRFKFNNSNLVHMCENGNLGILKFVFENCPELLSDRKSIPLELRDEMYFAALRNNHFQVVDWLHNNLQLYADCAYMSLPQLLFDEVLLFQTLDAAKWLQTNKKSDFTNSETAMDRVVAYGTIEMLEWMQANRPEFMVDKNKHYSPIYPKKYLGNTCRALIWAAKNGNLENIKWLFINSPEYNHFGKSYYGKSCLALDYAREIEHLHVYNWLIENVEGMKEYAI